ncbi:4-(cytidine 5'-diphospho)-2-C-methyl-D-erythritol kinase [Coraliomargarita sp. W4R72]
MDSVTLNSPAKINLMLSVHGQRGDGFHTLTSLVVALTFGDTLHVTRNDGDQDRLTCSDSAVPTGEGNLIIRAAIAFRQQLGRDVFFDFDLKKRIPMGAGLGGGSGNAAVALSAMNQLTDSPMARATLLDLAASLGSDCPFFIDSKPSIMTGRGEVLEPLPADVARQLHGQRVVLFKPDFSINTAWAYRQLMEAKPSAYESEALAIDRLGRFDASSEVNELLFNTFEPCVSQKYLAIQCLLDELRANEVACLMSGSGSCCFALARSADEVLAIRDICENALGSSVFFIETSIC